MAFENLKKAFKESSTTTKFATGVAAAFGAVVFHPLLIGGAIGAAAGAGIGYVGGEAIEAVKKVRNKGPKQ